VKIVNFILREDELKGSKEPKPRDRELDPHGNAMDLIIEHDQLF